MTSTMTVTLQAAWIAKCPIRSFWWHHYRPDDGSCRCIPERAAARNLAAEQRAVEEGHRAFVQRDGTVHVVSDSYQGKHYVVTFTDSGNGIRFACHPEGRMAYRDDHLERTAEPGVVPCKHAAVAARRLEREGFARFTDAGIWRSTGVAHVHDFTERRCVCGATENPLEGLPS